MNCYTGQNFRSGFSATSFYNICKIEHTSPPKKSSYSLVMREYVTGDQVKCDQDLELRTKVSKEMVLENIKDRIIPARVILRKEERLSAVLVKWVTLD